MTRIRGTCDESHDYKQEGEVRKPRQRGNEKELTPFVSYQLSVISLLRSENNSPYQGNKSVVNNQVQVYTVFLPTRDPA